MRKSIVLRESITIAASAEKICSYISDLSNDVHWRPEVEKMEVNGAAGVGQEVIEYITIYRFFRVVTPTVVKALDFPNRFEVETPATHPTWVHCIRSMEPQENGDVLFTVQLSFSLDNLKQILPFIPPAWAVRMWYQPRIRRYLRRLKTIMEMAG